jgi:hypothetical protein
MSSEQITALVAAATALEAAKVKAAQLEKEVRYTQNRLARAQAEVERLNAVIEAAKAGKPVEPTPTPALVEAKAELPVKAKKSA